MFSQLLKETSTITSQIPSELSCRNKQVLTVNDTDTLDKALNILSSNKIYSAPVFSPHAKKYVGIVGYSDLVAHVVRLYDKQPNLTELTSQFFITQVKHVVNESKRNLFHPVPEGTPLYDIVKILATGVYRVPIVDKHDSNKIINIITQSGVVQFLSKHINTLGPRAKQTIHELGIGLNNIVKVDHDKLAIEAFRLMQNKQISAVAVVDERGVLTNTLSISDIKYVGIEEGRKFRSLLLPVIDYISHVKQSEPLDSKWDGSTMFPAIHCYTDYTLEKAIMKIASTKVHRLFVVNQDDHPIGTISLRDIMVELVHLVHAH